MSDGETSDHPTILDYLNEDCWGLILQYVPVKDIISSERVSRKWQRVVLVYLQYARLGITVESPHCNVNEIHHDISWLMLKEADCSSFERWAYKLGSSVVACCCNTEQKFKIFGENCPNLEAARFIRLPEELLQNNRYENYKQLQWLCFRAFCNASDSCLSQYLAGAKLMDLEIIGNELLTGECLANIKATQLTYLFIQQCKRLHFRHLLSAADRLKQLTKFKLIHVSNDVYNNLYVVLDRMPQLEHLHIYVSSSNFREPIKKGSFFESVCRLANLRHLGTDLGAADEDLEAVTRCCKKLRSMLLEKCQDVTGRGLAAACRLAGARLRRLGVVSSRHLADEDVLACVRACPNLTDLDVRFCPALSGRLLGEVRAARRHLRAASTLRLFTNGTRLMSSDDDRGESDGVIMSFNFSGLLFSR